MKPHQRGADQHHAPARRPPQGDSLPRLQPQTSGDIRGPPGSQLEEYPRSPSVQTPPAVGDSRSGSCSFRSRGTHSAPSSRSRARAPRAGRRHGFCPRSPHPSSRQPRAYLGDIATRAMSVLGDTLLVVDKRRDSQRAHDDREADAPHSGHPDPRFWARARLRRNDAVILDTETTDLHGDVIQLSVIDLHGTTLPSTLVKPLSPISDTAARVHGITDADVAGAPWMAEIAPPAAGGHPQQVGSRLQRTIRPRGPGAQPETGADRSWTARSIKALAVPDASTCRHRERSMEQAGRPAPRPRRLPRSAPSSPPDGRPAR